VGRVDVLVVRTTADRAVAVAALARRRWPAAVVLAPRGVGPEGLAATGAVTPPAGGVVEAGPLRLRFEATGDHLEPKVTPAGEP
jgi:hypothetical protein